MLRAKLVNNGVSGTDRIFRVVVMICVCVYWQRPAFSDEPAAAPEQQSHLQFAPIYISHSVDGLIFYDYLYTKYGVQKNQRQSLSVRVNGRVNVRTFFWQPWLALVSGSLNAGVGKSLSKSNSSSTNSTLSTSYGGDAALNLVKFSRFPFQAKVFRQNSKFNASYSGGHNDKVLTGYSLDQTYWSKRGKFQASAGFNSQKEVGSYSIGPLYTDIFSYNSKFAPFKSQSVWISGMAMRQNQPLLGQSRLNDSLQVNHLYQPSMSFSVASIVNLSKYGTTSTQVSSPTQVYDANSQQFSSMVSLRPERSPLTMTGSVRFFKSDLSTNGIIASKVKLSNFNLGANYLFSKLVRLYGSVDVTDSNGTQTVYTNTALTASSPFRFKSTTGVGGFRYSGSIGGTLFTTNLNTTSAGQTTSQSTLGVRIYLSHALDKSSDFNGGKLAKRLYQTLTMGYVDNAYSLSNLLSGGSLTWGRVQGREATTFRLSAADSRSLRGTPFSFQMINLQATRTQTMNNNESLRGSLTVQGTHMVSSTPTPLFTISPSAEIGYINRRVFKVRHLSLRSTLHISDSNIAPTQIQSYENQATRSWINNLDYKIGLLTTGLQATVARVYNSTQSSIYFFMARSF
jgi:hypothetical protein